MNFIPNQYIIHMFFVVRIYSVCKSKKSDDRVGSYGGIFREGQDEK